MAAGARLRPAQSGGFSNFDRQALRLYRHAAAAAPNPAGYHPSSPEHHGALLYLLGACAAGGALREGF